MSSDKTTERFAQLFQRIEKTPSYRVEGLKVEVAEQIYLAMQRGGINNAELARRLGKSRAYVTKVLSGNVNFTLETLVTIGDALNCEIALGLKLKASSVAATTRKNPPKTKLPASRKAKKKNRVALAIVLAEAP
ncbi:MAG: helix-turn-helix transcriptional regulator [Acidobacteria bacterium]|nr:helix-turn-helix transcriptional regulator [Acidobacteriota bacterium]